MADDPNITPVPKCTRATTALISIARARGFGNKAVISLIEAQDASLGFAVGAIIEGMVRELEEAEAALASCRQG